MLRSIAAPPTTAFDSVPNSATQWNSHDPFAIHLRPPPNETPLQREERVAHEREAKRISDEIDAGLELEKRKLKGEKGINLLLLGQSESGKSTTLKQFQLMYAPQAFRQERASWRLVIQLNLVRSIRLILAQLEAHSSNTSYDPTSPRSLHPLTSSGAHGSTTTLNMSSTNLYDPDTTPASPTAFSSYTSNSSRSTQPALRLTDVHRALRMRLLPLMHVEASLLRRLDPSGEDYEATRLGTDWQPSVHRELYVRSHSGWKDKIARIRGGRTSAGETNIDFDDPEDPGHVIHACRDDMIALWNDPIVRQIVKLNGPRLEDMPGFFLDDIERITEERYIPSDEDVLKARMKTIGVSEHKFMVSGPERSSWTIYDVGGTRTQRAAWQPFFESVHALIFLAPISAFDQALTEDRRVNRLEDSLLLFKMVCSSKLLKNVNILLFLNKIDILENKLNNGVRVAKYVKSYGERPNELEPVCKFFRGKFSAIHKEYTPQPSKRTFYAHLTTVVDKKATRVLLSTVCDVIFRDNLRMSHLC